MGRIPEQGYVLQEAMALDPLNEMLAINYAGNLHVQGDYEGARELITDLIQLRPDSVTLLRMMSGFAFGRGDLVDAWQYASRSYELEPESPVIVTTMAKAWMELGEIEESEKVLLSGLEIASDNADLKTQYFFLLLFSDRIEEAERLVKEQFGTEIASLPEQLQRFYHFQMGMIFVARGELERARDSLEQAVDSNEIRGLDDSQIFALTMAALINEQLGYQELANQRLATAERLLRRALINGVDNAGIYYNLTVVFALRGDNERAMEAFRQAYDKGWRQSWVLKIDGRLASLRSEPEFVEIERQIQEEVARARTEIMDLKVVLL